MYLLDWKQIKDDLYEESQIVMSNHQTLLVLRRWDVDTIGKEYKFPTKVTPMGIIRSGPNGIMILSVSEVSRDQLLSCVRDNLLNKTFSEISDWLHVKTPYICGLLPKKIKREIEEFYG